MFASRLQAIGWTVALAVSFTSARAVLAASPPETSKPLVETALQNILNLDRAGQDGFATIWDGNKYVQCKLLADRSLRCEAAGTLMQSSLEHVLTPEHISRLASFGWRLDPSFGNYAQSFPTGIPTSLVADKILQVLA